ncbi:MAG: O-antigen ligase family protein, partial [Mariprofundaceae bacterium]|nr:O-antigen ligase family protein [Mariprofundaceae bacterium]
RDQPWFGVGLGQFSAHYLTYQSKASATLDAPLPEQTAVDSAHNLLLQLMAEAGVLGMAFWLMITSVLLRISWVYRWQLTSRTWPFLACAWLLWIQGMGNITLSRPYAMLMFALFLGVACAPMLRLNRGTKISLKKPLLLVITLTMLIALAWSAVQKTAHWLDYEQLLFSADAIGNKKKAELTAALMNEPSILPFLIEGIVSDHLLDPKRQISMMTLQPYVQKALLLRQDPLLLQQQLYMYVLAKKWQQACDVAHILMPMSSQADNKAAYLDVCAHKKPKTFVFLGFIKH